MALTPDHEDRWAGGPGAGQSVEELPERVEARVLMLYGTQAEVVTAHHPADDPVCVPAAALALQLGVDLRSLPGRRFSAAVLDDRVVDAELIS
ncbi:hypothetical protein [Nonomuraea jiangxiensis]|uniref:Uncharacterized protein n=1 Tax=Nonomuraea jiangxiensis TaxID=633440 RepID=A0A1G9N3T1_9ACTN|nr:hypothetical protein [Nonomuraea jiangxiensis]SDL81236.1 hypothetical protein SAMN05421869_13131 [Nonomuraea jiangxiensis]